MSRQISSERKGAYYIGMAMIILGVLLFASNFIFVPMSIGNGSGPAAAKSVMVGMVGRALGGMALIVIGGIVRGVGARGLSGSGMVLNPQQARRDLEPYSRMAGGMIKDAVDESGIEFGGGSERQRNEPEKVVMLKCRECGQLNEEDSKFCQECGKPI